MGKCLNSSVCSALCFLIQIFTTKRMFISVHILPVSPCLILPAILWGKCYYPFSGDNRIIWITTSTISLGWLVDISKSTIQKHDSYLPSHTCSLPQLTTIYQVPWTKVRIIFDLLFFLKSTSTQYASSTAINSKIASKSFSFFLYLSPPSQI